MNAMHALIGRDGVATTTADLIAVIIALTDPEREDYAAHHLADKSKTMF